MFTGLLPVSIWVPPPATILKLNVDITFRSPSDTCGIGYILRDSTDTIIMAGTGTTCAGSVEAAECCGVLAAIQWCLGHEFRRIQVETDNAGAAAYLSRAQTNISWCSPSILVTLNLLALNTAIGQLDSDLLFCNVLVFMHVNNFEYFDRKGDKH
ncbi:hypothetical protein FRX31_008240 [Thalictrum thalictroides]|uniref:RNase H type-1 domain-containing protein n=1 Tax=Thalictrum thalictroides TaxID=46969 RepID=A0A7J6WXJ1_THATH|nr:hypothetical protein FRX31_008240 [Thalictrum thalictroides]